MRCRGRSLLPRVAVVTAAFLLVFDGGAWGQMLNFGAGDSDQPIEIEADDGIEWQQDNEVVVARGNARAIRGEVEVRADILRAYYRKSEAGGNEISRLDAEGSVEISSQTERAWGDAGVYDVEKAVLVLSGRKVRLTSGEDEITADQQLEYFNVKQMAVARGNAYARRGENSLRGDVLVAHFRRDQEGKNRIHRVEAFDNIHIVTPQDEVWADRGVYDVETSIATLTGEVTIVRGENTLAGCTAEVNLETGISRLKSCKEGGRRVRGLLLPEDRKQIDSPDKAKDPSER